MVKRIQSRVASAAHAMEVLVLKVNKTRSRLWKTLNDQPESRLLATGIGMPLQVFECKMIEITFIF